MHMAVDTIRDSDSLIFSFIESGFQVVVSSKWYSVEFIAVIQIKIAASSNR